MLCKLMLFTTLAVAATLDARGGWKKRCTAQVLHAPPGPTRTIYTTTSTYTSLVDCSRCTILSPTTAPGTANVTVTARGPVVVTQLSCSPTPTPTFWAAPPGTTETIMAKGVVTPDCTRTIGLAPVLPKSTLVIYPTTITQTSKRFCGTCALVWSTQKINPLVPVRYVATKTTDKPSIATHLTCSEGEETTTASPHAWRALADSGEGEESEWVWYG